MWAKALRGKLNPQRAEKASDPGETPMKWEQAERKVPRTWPWLPADVGRGQQSGMVRCQAWGGGVGTGKGRWCI